jgi:hypothetical protein
MINATNHKQQTTNNNIELIIDTTNNTQGLMINTIQPTTNNRQPNNNIKLIIDTTDIAQHQINHQYNQQRSRIDDQYNTTNHKQQTTQQHQINHRYNEHRSTSN